MCVIAFGRNGHKDTYLNGQVQIYRKGEQEMKRRRMKASLLAAVIFVFSVSIGDVFAETMIVRGEININDGSTISFSVPINV